MKIRFALNLLILCSFYLFSCNPLIDWDWNDDSTPTQVYHGDIPEFSVGIDSIIAIGETSAVVYFTIHPDDNFRIDKINISISLVDRLNPYDFILLYNEEYINFESTECLVTSSINSKKYPLFLSRDVPMNCCAQLDNLDSDTEYSLFISPSSEKEWPSQCVHCPHYMFKFKY